MENSHLNESLDEFSDEWMKFLDESSEESLDEY